MKHITFFFLLLVCISFVYAESSSSSINWVSCNGLAGGVCPSATFQTLTTINQTVININTTSINASSINVNGLINAYGYLINSTSLYDIFYPRYSNPIKYQNDSEVNNTIDAKLAGNSWHLDIPLIANYTAGNVTQLTVTNNLTAAKYTLAESSGTGDTYMYAPFANVIDFIVNGGTVMRFDLTSGMQVLNGYPFFATGNLNVTGWINASQVKVKGFLNVSSNIETQANLTAKIIKNPFNNSILIKFNSTGVCIGLQC